MGSPDAVHRAVSRPSICLSGSFHSGNRGDASIQLSAMLELKRRWPEAHIHFLSCHPEEDAELYPGVSLVPSMRRRPWRAAHQLARLCAKRLIGKAAVSGDTELETLGRADLLIDLSGDGFTETFGWKCPASHAVPLLLARLLGVPSVVMAQSIGPFTRAKTFYRRLFSAARMVLCRDEESLVYLKRLGVESKLCLTADLAFLLPPAPQQKLQAALPWLEEFAGKDALIGVTPSNLYNVRNERVRRTLFETLAVGATRLARSSGGKILVIPTVFGPGEQYDDRLAAARLARQLGPPERVRVLETPLAPRVLKTLLGRLDAYVGARMHGLIGALSQAVPSMGIAYAEKTGNLFRRLEIEEYATHPGKQSLHEFEQKAENLWQEREHVRAHLESVLSGKILPAAQKNFELLEELLDLAPERQCHADQVVLSR